MFLSRAKYFKGKKIHGEIDIKVEQVSWGKWIWGSTELETQKPFFCVWCRQNTNILFFSGRVLWSQPCGSCQWWILCGHGSSSEWGKSYAVSIKWEPYCYEKSIKNSLRTGRESSLLHPTVSKQEFRHRMWRDSFSFEEELRIPAGHKPNFSVIHSQTLSIYCMPSAALSTSCLIHIYWAPTCAKNWILYMLRT